jgi:hypothetical protein
MTTDQDKKLSKAVSEVHLWIADNYPCPPPIRHLYDAARTVLAESQNNPFTEHWKSEE